MDLTHRNLSQKDNLHRACRHLIYRQVVETISSGNLRQPYNFSKKLEQ